MEEKNAKRALEVSVNHSIEIDTKTNKEINQIFFLV